MNVVLLAFETLELCFLKLCAIMGVVRILADWKFFVNYCGR